MLRLCLICWCWDLTEVVPKGTSKTKTKMAIPYPYRLGNTEYLFGLFRVHIPIPDYVHFVAHELISFLHKKIIAD